VMEGAGRVEYNLKYYGNPEGCRTQITCARPRLKISLRWLS
jgi:hypothetical protein